MALPLWRTLWLNDNYLHNIRLREENVAERYAWHAIMFMVEKHLKLHYFFLLGTYKFKNQSMYLKIIRRRRKENNI